MFEQDELLMTENTAEQIYHIHPNKKPNGKAFFSLNADRISVDPRNKANSCFIYAPN